MKGIKFRVWDKKEKRFNPHLGISQEGKVLGETGAVARQDNYIINWGIEKDNREFYEGDTFRFYDEKQFTYVVKQKDEYFGLCKASYPYREVRSIDLSGAKYIGNCLIDPKLLVSKRDKICKEKEEMTSIHNIKFNDDSFLIMTSEDIRNIIEAKESENDEIVSQEDRTYIIKGKNCDVIGVDAGNGWYKLQNLGFHPGATLKQTSDILTKFRKVISSYQQS